MFTQVQSVFQSEREFPVGDRDRFPRSTQRALDVPGHVISTLVRVPKKFIVPRFRNDSIQSALEVVRERVGGASDDERRGRVLTKGVERADGGAANRVANRVLDFIRDVSKTPLPDAYRDGRLRRRVRLIAHAHDISRVSPTVPADVSMLVEIDALPRSHRESTVHHGRSDGAPH